MNFFIDTEFTDFRDCELISFALVSECGEYEFYQEIAFDERKCNEFVRENVLIHLSSDAPTWQTTRHYQNQFLDWIREFKAEEFKIFFDHQRDWDLFKHFLGDQFPLNMRGKNIWNKINPSNYLNYFSEHHVPQHHALHDARAARFAYDVKFNRSRAQKLAHKFPPR